MNFETDDRFKLHGLSLKPVLNDEENSRESIARAAEVKQRADIPKVCPA
jgi:hypothetical protein